MKLRAQEIANLINGEYSGPADLTIDGEFRFDSREVKRGDVFLALRGEHQDGHDFIAAAVANGAALAITTRTVSAPHIRTDDVITAIGELARRIRERLPNLKVIGITGSQGKTTTKDILAGILKSQGETVAPERSFNNDLGVPITLLRCDESTQFCILELGARHGGDIARLAAIAMPDVGIVLRVGTAHLGEFGSRAGIAQAKAELVQSLKSDGIAILGTYDEFTPKMAVGLNSKVLTFGEGGREDVRAADIELHGARPSFDLVTPQGRERVELQLFGPHQIANALAASAAAYALGIDTAAIAASLCLHQNSGNWRMEISEVGGVTVINDAYNANPESMAAALRALALMTQEQGGRSWAFLGRMHELGDESDRLHKEVGALAHELRIDHLVAIGEPMFLSGSTSDTREHLISDLGAALELLPELAASDVVLVKASRAEGLERLAAAILANQSQPESSYGSGGAQ